MPQVEVKSYQSFLKFERIYSWQNAYITITVRFKLYYKRSKKSERYPTEYCWENVFEVEIVCLYFKVWNWQLNEHQIESEMLKLLMHE